MFLSVDRGTTKTARHYVCKTSHAPRRLVIELRNGCPARIFLRSLLAELYTRGAYEEASMSALGKGHHLRPYERVLQRHF